MTTWCLYELFDPRFPREIRYIGASRNPEKRLPVHMKQARSKPLRTSPKALWLRRLHAAGIKPAMRVIYRELSLEEVKKLEQEAIANAWATGHPLTNSTRGGEVYAPIEFTEAQKAAMGMIKKAPVPTLHTMPYATYLNVPTWPPL